MDTTIIAVYALCADLLIGMRHQEDAQVQLTDAEIMTTAIVAMLFFHGNFDEAFRGKLESKKRYFYGLKLHLMITAQGQPVEFFLTPGAFADVSGLQYFEFDLPEGSSIYADRIYNDPTIEDILQDVNLYFWPMRKKNSTRPFPPYVCFLQHRYRKMIETSGSLLEQLLPKHIHAVTAEGFELKAVLFVLALSFHFLAA